MTAAHRAAESPFATAVEAGKDYWWCACGLSRNQPFCDGSHKGTTFVPVEFVMIEKKKVSLCTCRRTKKTPYCDGTHAKVD